MHDESGFHRTTEDAHCFAGNGATEDGTTHTRISSFALVKQSHKSLATVVKTIHTTKTGTAISSVHGSVRCIAEFLRAPHLRASSRSGIKKMFARAGLKLLL